MTCVLQFKIGSWYFTAHDLTSSKVLLTAYRFDRDFYGLIPCPGETEKDERGKPIAGHELRRKSITLGSMSCSKEDITRRISLGYAAFKKCNKAWGNNISRDKRLLLHEALVVSVFMYNPSCWAA